MGEIWSELRRRNVFRVAIAYVALGWMLLQLTGIVVPGFDLPGWTFRFITFVLIVGFPLILIFAWAFELTPGGLKRVGNVDAQASLISQTGRRIDFAIIGILSVALSFFIVDRLFTTLVEKPIRSQEVIRSSIAVLPFLNMSNDPDQAYFSDGISEEILNVLAQIPDLHVTSRSSAFQFRGDDIHIPAVAEKLGVANILEGSVRRSGTRIRITAQLIDASTDRHLWTNTYDRELTDIFAIQDEISKSIVDALHVHLGLATQSLADVRKTDTEAYRLYLLGRYSFEQRTQNTLYKAIDLFDQAMAIDPDYAPAYAGKADAYMLLFAYGDLTLAESTSFAQPLIDKALKLDPELAEAYVSKGLLLHYRWQIEASALAFARAVELNPNLARAWQWRASILHSSLQFKEELAAWRRAHNLDPLSSSILRGYIHNRMRFGDFSATEELLERLRTIEPDGALASLEASHMHAVRGNWALSYSFAKEAFEANPAEFFAANLEWKRVRLKAYDPEIVQLSKIARMRLDAIYNPELVWQDYQTLLANEEDCHCLEINLASARSRLGKYQDALDLMEGMPYFSEDLPGPFYVGILPYDTGVSLLALAKRKTGDEAGASRVISTIEQYIETMREQGALWTLQGLEAEVHALKGDHVAMVAALEEAVHDGYIPWFDLDSALYDAVRDREDFQVIVRSVDAKINEERSRLGWDPVE